jgi:thiol-disulfide isomerase/thioredoxin
MNRLTIFFLLFQTSVNAQNGVIFTDGTWWQIVNEAKREQKPIFVDFYTKWCGGCKMMEQQIMPNHSVGWKYNKSFINYKVDAESFDGVNVAMRFGIGCYPTYVFVDPNNGKTLFKEEGIMLDASKFNAYGNVALAKFKKVNQPPTSPPQFIKKIVKKTETSAKKVSGKAKIKSKKFAGKVKIKTKKVVKKVDKKLS